MYSDYKKILLPLIVVLWMGVIFAMSAQEADESARVSGGIGRFIASITVPGFEDFSEEKQEMIAEKLDYPIRKTAHATEYAILGALACVSLQTYRVTGKKRNMLAWLISTGYAATDEFHQLFVKGRSGQVSDVVLDSMGSICGILVFLLILYFVKKTFNKKKSVL